MIRSLLVCTVLVAAALPKAVPPVTKTPSPAPAQQPVWNMKTSQMNANMLSGRFSAPNHVLLLRGDGSTVDADRAAGNYKQKRASLFGHVTVHDVGGTLGLHSATNVQTRGPATLTADELHVDDQNHTYDAAGHVHYEQADSIADADTAHLNDATHELDLRGKVHVVQGDRTIDSDHATYNTLTGLGQADTNVTITMPGPSPSIATPKPITLKKPKIP
ncbi:MAG TPA: LPS export ABC transporter periplasmic protein LptC [Candidatus Baltobacteraceae bacterium]|jgi:lipopolysaccharide assembly outer membrane protein LptD (OstA)|nr:LPS export ABC transporter periplasmic protein LptC [Candidatus Baltobacteraceae bacterium]